MEQSENEIVEFSEFEAQLLKFEKDYGSRVYDLTDTTQEIAARGDRLAVAKVQSAFQKVKVAVKERAQSIVNNTNKKGKIINDRLEAVKQNIKGQLDKRDQELKEHAEKLQGTVDEITQLCIFVSDDRNQTQINPDSRQITQRLSIIKNIVIDDAYEDRKADATLAKIETIKELETILSGRIKFEKDEAELEKLRKEKEERQRAEREEQIRKEATEKATREVEKKAEREAVRQRELAEEEKRKAQAEIDKAKREKEAAEQAVKLVEEQAREQLAREQIQKEEKERIEQKKIENKKADKNHRKIVENRAIESFIKCAGIDRKTAGLIVMVIADRKIQDVSINY